VEAENVVKKNPLNNVEKELWDYQFYFMKTPKELKDVTNIKTAY
jgi:hypothetical protein